MARPRVGTDGFVYFLLAEEVNRVKIGFSMNPDSRISSLKTGCPCSVLLLGSVEGTQDDETALHHLLENDRCEGEWFDCTVAVMEVIGYCLRTGRADAKPFVERKAQRYLLDSYRDLLHFLRYDPAWRATIPMWLSDGLIRQCDRCVKYARSRYYPVSTIASPGYSWEVATLQHLVCFVAHNDTLASCGGDAWKAAAQTARDLVWAIPTHLPSIEIHRIISAREEEASDACAALLRLRGQPIICGPIICGPQEASA